MKTAYDYGKRALIDANVMAALVAINWSLAAYGLAHDWPFLHVLSLVVAGACGLVMVIVNLIICSVFIRQELDGEDGSLE